MSVHLLLEGILIGFLVAVPVGPLGLLCINRSLAVGPVCGFVSGLGVASADALAAAIAALGITLISSFVFEHQLALRLLGGIFLVYLGWRIYRTRPASQNTPGNVGNLFSAYATTFLLTFSNPVTILSFMAIYAARGMEVLRQHYLSAAVLTAGVFAGSALWWILVFCAMVFFRDAVSTRLTAAVHKVSGTIIAGFGVIVLLSLPPVRAALGIRF